MCGATRPRPRCRTSGPAWCAPSAAAGGTKSMCARTGKSSPRLALPRSVTNILNVDDTHKSAHDSRACKTVLQKLRGGSMYMIAALGLATGMRRGELLALRWQDVDLDGGKLRVERSLEQTKAGLRFK